MPSLGRIISIVTLAVVLACAPSSAPNPARASLLITNASVIDGTGSPARRAAVRVEGDRITAVGELAARSGEPVVDARGLVLSPGFIDTHTHADGGLDEHPDALAVVSQGITTIIGGQDGGSPIPLAAFFAGLEKAPATVNVGMYVGHGSIRDSVMGSDFRRVATATEVARMSTILAAEMRAGAIGLSSGLEYDPGIYSDRSEIIELAKVAASFGGRYISHIRSEDYAFWQAIDEIIAIGREAKLPVQISHAKLAMRSLWGRADSLILLLDQARARGIDITADIYPYLYWHSTLTVLFPKRDFDNRAAAEFALTETSTPAGLLLGRYEPNPAYAGKTVAEIARMRGTDSITTLIDLIRESEAMRKSTGRSTQSVIGTSMVEPDVERIMRWPHTNLGTDGALAGPHPRGYGAFPRFLGVYVRERKVMSLEEAVRRMTSLSAQHVGIRDRGRIAPGMYADLVLFDSATVADRATPREPHLTSVGIARVWVNGVAVYGGGKVTGAKPGKVIKRQGRGTRDSALLGTPGSRFSIPDSRFPVRDSTAMVGDRSVVVIGASTGIGLATTRVLVSQDVHAFASVRRDVDAVRLRQEFGAGVTPLLFDVTGAGAIRAAVPQVRDALDGRTLWGLVNNAGIAVGGPLIHQPLDEVRRHSK